MTRKDAVDAPFERVRLTYAGRERPYALHVPREVQPSGAPLLVELHGRGTDAAWTEEVTRFVPRADERGWVVAAPAAVGELWNDGRNPDRAGNVDDVAHLVAVIDAVAARVTIDARRVYVAGLSNGAFRPGNSHASGPTA